VPKIVGIYKRGNKYYGAKWYRGKTYTTTVYDTSEEASEALQVLIRKLQKGVNLTHKSLTVSGFIKVYLDKYIRNKPNMQGITIKTIESRLSVIEETFVQDLQNRLYAKYAQSYAFQVMCQFHRLLKRAVIWDYIERDPSIGVDVVYPHVEKPTGR
jgi:hypothetical protein